MKQYWRRPFQFWTDFKRSVEAEAIPEPQWFRCVTKNPPGQYNILGRKPWRKLSFPLDEYRKLYYADYPTEAMQYAHSALPGETKYRKTPMEIFLERHCELTSQGLDGDLAYLQCQEEKEAREFTQHLERIFCAQQAVNFYGIDPSPPDEKPGLTPYEKARNAVMKEHRDRLSAIIRMKRDAQGEEARVEIEDVEGISNEELLEYIRLHPDDAKIFDESVFLVEEEEEGHFSGVAPPSSDFANEEAVQSYFGVGDYWDPLKYEGKDIRTITNQDLKNIQTDTTKMLDDLSEMLGIDANSDTLYDSLSDSGRFEVLQAWTSAMPDSRQLLAQPYYSSRMSQHLAQYQQSVSDAESGPTAAQRKDAAFMDATLTQPFTEYSETVSQMRSTRAKRADPLKYVISQPRSSSGKL